MWGCHFVCWVPVRFARGLGGGNWAEALPWTCPSIHHCTSNNPFPNSRQLPCYSQNQCHRIPSELPPATTRFSSKLLKDCHQLGVSSSFGAQVLSSTGTPASSWVPGVRTTQLLLFKGLGPGSAFPLLNSENRTLVPLFPRLGMEPASGAASKFSFLLFQTSSPTLTSSQYSSVKIPGVILVSWQNWYKIPNTL